MSGYEVELVEDGGQGVEKALAWRPDEAVVDIGLPVLNGYEVARQVRAALGQAIRLIALTAYACYSDRQAAYRAGFDAHLSKPADPQDLCRLLDSLCQWNAGPPG
jgi:CheY-like chemotaxis protein